MGGAVNLWRAPDRLKFAMRRALEMAAMWPLWLATCNNGRTLDLPGAAAKIQPR